MLEREGYTMEVMMSGLRLHILIVEDEIAMQKLTAKILTREGCTVKIAKNGLEALEALRSDTFDLVLMDMQMPEMCGIETAKIIRNRKGRSNFLFPDIPIIALTSFPPEEARKKCLMAGMNGFLKKPFQMDRFLREVKALVSDGTYFLPGLNDDEKDRKKTNKIS